MTSYRLRVQVRDVPGALAELTGGLAGAGCDLLRVDVHGVDGHVAVDEVSLVAPDDLAGDDLADLVAGAGATALLVAPLPMETDVDPVAAALTLAGELAASPGPAERLRAGERGLAGLLRAEAAWLLPAPAAGEPLLAHEVLDAPTVVAVPTAGGAARDVIASLALLPAGGLLGVALRWGRWSFTASELARGTALVDLAARSLPPAVGTPAPAVLATTTTGAHVAVRPLGPGDGAHLLDLDLRLSDRTRRLRFHGSRGLPTGAELRHLTAHGTDAGVAVGAWSERGLVGVARLVPLPDDPGSAELAVVVADAEQRPASAASCSTGSSPRRPTGACAGWSLGPRRTTTPSGGSWPVTRPRRSPASRTARSRCSSTSPASPPRSPVSRAAEFGSGC